MLIADPKYRSLSEDEKEDLFERAHESYVRKPSGKDSEVLIQVFRPSLVGWAELLVGCKRCTCSYHHALLSMASLNFLPSDPDIKLDTIVGSLKSYTYEDIFDEIVLCFLETCLKVQTGPRLLKTVQYRLVRSLSERIKILVTDPIVYARWGISSCQVGIEEDDYTATKWSSLVHEDSSHIAELFLHAVEGDEEMSPLLHGGSIEDVVTAWERPDGLIGVKINDSWVKGVTCGLGGVPAFTSLTDRERQLLVRRYLIHQNRETIAKEMEYTGPTQVRDELHRTKVKLAKVLLTEA